MSYEHEMVGLEAWDGAFRRAEIRTPQGVVSIAARALVVAAGGFEANLEWLAEYRGAAAANFAIRGTPYNRGSMLRLLLDNDVAPVGDPTQCHAVAVDARGPRFDGGIVTRLDCVVFGSGSRGRVRGALALMLYHPEFAEHAQALGEVARYRSGFPPALSELMIAIVARHYDCEYEWSVHAPIAEAAGIPRTVLADIGDGRPPAFEDKAQEVTYQFTAALLQSNRVDDDTFERFRARFGESGVVAAAAILGYYGLIAHLLNAVRMPPRGEGLPGSRRGISGE